MEKMKSAVNFVAETSPDKCPWNFGPHETNNIIFVCFNLFLIQDYISVLGSHKFQYSSVGCCVFCLYYSIKYLDRSTWSVSQLKLKLKSPKIISWGKIILGPKGNRRTEEPLLRYFQYIAIMVVVTVRWLDLRAYPSEFPHKSYNQLSQKSLPPTPTNKAN